MNPKKTGEFILQKRKSKNITQQELAELLNVTNKAISRWETGEGYPDISLLPQLATILNCTVDEILKGEAIEKEKKERKNISISSFTLIFSMSIIFMLIMSIVIAYATFYEWIGFLILGLTVLGSSIAYILLRQKYLSLCDYDDNDKKLIFKNTFIFYTVCIISLFIYLPLMVFDPNLSGDAPIKSIISFTNVYFYYASISALIGAVISVITIYFHYQKVFKAYNLVNIFKIIGVTLLSGIISYCFNFAPNSIFILGVYIIPIIAIILLIIFKAKKKINPPFTIFILLISIMLFYTLYLVLIDLNINDEYVFATIAEYDNRIFNPLVFSLMSLIHFVPLISAAISYKKGINKKWNIYIIMVCIALIITIILNSILNQTYLYTYYF